MSEDRKVLVAKRKGDRNKGGAGPSKSDLEVSHCKRGTKRPLFPNSTPKKNLANDRLKRLRTSLNEEVQKSSDKNESYHQTFAPNNKVKFSKSLNKRKRPQSALEEPVEARSKIVLNKTSLSCTAECEPQKSIFTANLSNLSEKTQISTDSIEDMEWSTAEDNITCIAVNTCTPIASHGLDSTVDEKICTTSASHALDGRNNDQTFKNHYFIVVDTNIFLSHLQIIKDVITMNIPDNITPVIYIPWIVIEELDFIKEDSSKASLKFKAQDAIKYIEKTLCSKHERMMGQTLNEANEQKYCGKGQDNKLIACCLQVLEKYHNMILLTGDINLKNKAHINSIPVCSHSEIFAKITMLNKTKAQVILNKMTALCTTIINECAKKAYGLACHKMPICQSPPKTLQDCISIFTKYWFPVFQEILMKQFKKSIDDLSSFLSNKTVIANDSNELNDLVRLCVRVCLFLKDVECCKGIIENTIRDLNNIKEL